MVIEGCGQDNLCCSVTFEIKSTRLDLHGGFSSICRFEYKVWPETFSSTTTVAGSTTPWMSLSWKILALGRYVLALLSSYHINGLCMMKWSCRLILKWTLRLEKVWYTEYMDISGERSFYLHFLPWFSSSNWGTQKTSVHLGVVGCQSVKHTNEYQLDDMLLGCWVMENGQNSE